MITCWLVLAISRPKDGKISKGKADSQNKKRLLGEALALTAGWFSDSFVFLFVA
jgi:hypothetical protein